MPLGKQFFATFTNGTAGGVTGLVPLINITSQALGSYTQSALVTNQTMSAVTNCSGSYFYNFTAGDLTQFNYMAAMNSTNSTLDSPVSFALWTSQQADLISVNGTASAASALSFAANDTNNRLQTSSYANGQTLSANVNVLTINGSASAAAALSFATNDTNNRLQVSSYANGQTLNSNVLTINGSSSAASALSFAANDTNNFMKVSAYPNGQTLNSSANVLQWNSVNVTGMPMPTYTQPTGFLAATFPALLASTTNITGGTINYAQTVGTLTNLPPITAGTVTLAASQPLYTPAIAGDAMSLTSGERTTLTAVIWNALTSGMITVGSIGKRIVDFLTGDSYTRLGAPVGASISADIANSSQGIYTIIAGGSGNAATFSLIRGLTNASDSTSLTAHALALAPTGGGGGSTVNVETELTDVRTNLQ